MSNTIRIGNAELGIKEFVEEHRERSVFTIYVPALSRPEAPAFPGAIASRHQNAMHFPPTMLYDMATQFKLDGLFFHPETGLLAGDIQKVQSFVAADVDDIDAAIATFRQRATLINPHLEGCAAEVHLARMMWFAWWMRWALKHCPNPAMQRM